MFNYLVGSLISDSEASAQLCIGMAGLLISIYAFGSTFLFLVFQLTFHQFDLFFEELKSDKQFARTNIFYWVAIVVNLVGGVFCGRKEQNSFIISLCTLMSLGAIGALIMYFRKVFSYFGFGSLLNTTVKRIKAAIDAVVSNEGIIVGYRDTAEWTDTPNSAIWIHPNKDLVQLFGILEKIFMSSDQVRRRPESIEQYHELLKKAFELQDSRILKNDIRTPKLELYSDEWAVESKLLEQTDAEPALLARRTVAKQTNSFQVRNVLIEDWLCRFLRNVIFRYDDYHFIEGMVVNHRKWLQNLAREVAASEQKTVPQSQMMSIFFLWIQILNGLILPNGKSTAINSRKFRMIFDEFCLELHEDRTSLVFHAFVRANVNALMRQIININNPEYFDLLIHMRDSIVRRESGKSFLDSKRTTHSIILGILESCMPRSLRMIPLVIDHIFDRLQSSRSAEEFADVVHLSLLQGIKEFETEKTDGNESERKIAETKIIVLILIAIVLEKHYPDGENMRRLTITIDNHKHYLDAIQRNEYHVSRVLEQLHYTPILNPTIYAFRSRITDNGSPDIKNT